MQNSENNQKRITLLDCTLRDGGYFNNWQFSKELAMSLVNSLNRAGVNIIEMGYKSPKTRKSDFFEGLFRYCTESQLHFLKGCDKSEFAFMVDAKDFIINGQAQKELIHDAIFPSEESVFKWARVAAYAHQLKGCHEVISILKELGYNVTFNLMGFSLLSETKMHEAVKLASQFPSEVFYFSDSFGDLTPNDISRCLSVIRLYYTGKVGIHTHDNNGLAFANTLAALDLGIDFIDSTIMGMGRGAGNLRTEQIMLYLYFKKHYLNFNPSELLETIDRFFIQLQQKFGWGWDYTYMLSAMQNIHPTYCMNLRASNQYTIEQVSAILNEIDPSKRQTYNNDVLLKAIDIGVNIPLDKTEPLCNLSLYQPVKKNRILIISTGPSVETFREEIVEFIRQKNPFVIECNPKSDYFEKNSQDYIITILNWVRLKKRQEMQKKTGSPIVTGIQAIPRFYIHHTSIYTIPCHVKKNEILISNTGLTLPAYVVGMYAVGLGLLSQPDEIFLAGYDGYDNPLDPKHQDMNLFWNTLSAPVPLISLTPTTYPLRIEPIYTHIQ